MTSAVRRDPVSGHLRVVLRLRVADGAQERFLAAYRRIRHRVAEVDGYLGDQLCQSEDDPADWVLTSVWASPAHFHAWESGAPHRVLAAPLMACVTAREASRYHVRLTTGPGGVELDPGELPRLDDGQGEHGEHGGDGVHRYALTFPVRPGSEAAVAEILSGYAAPPAGRPEAARPLLDRTSVFMAGPVVVRVVDITCPPAEAIRHLAGQPQIRAVEERLRPHLEHDRDLSDDSGRRRFLATSVMRVVASRNGQDGHPPRAAALYQALPGRGGEVARLLAGDGTGGGVTVFRRRDLVVRLVESHDETPAVPMAGVLAPLVRLARPMTLVTDRVVGVRS